MNDIKELKKQLGEKYKYTRNFTDRAVSKFIRKPPPYFSEKVVAILEMGSVKLEAVLYKYKTEILLGYDFYVKDNILSKDWIYYDSPKDKVKLSETKMYEILNRVVQDNGLSYTECSFEKIEGKDVTAKKKKPENPT